MAISFPAIKPCRWTAPVISKAPAITCISTRRARLLAPEQPLESYPWSSYPLYLKEPVQRPSWLRTDRVLGEWGIQWDSAAGRHQFALTMEARRKAEQTQTWDILPRLRCAAAAHGEKACQLWHGFCVKVFDGTTTNLPDTPKKQMTYGIDDRRKLVWLHVLLLSIVTAHACSFAILCSLTFCGAGSGLAESAPNQLSPDEKAAGWELLFDGQTHQGWHSFKRNSFPATGWLVEDGWLHCLGTSGGDVLSDREFDQFELQWDWKLEQGGNSGLKYFVLESRNSALGHEYQMLDDQVNPDGKLGGSLLRRFF